MLAYGFVLIIQVTINFYLCKIFVFKKRNKKSTRNQFIMFFSGIIGFRMADWLIYSLAVEKFGFYFLYVQIFNILLFALIKFKYTEKVMEK